MGTEYCYIIDQYNKFQNNSNVIDVFTLQMGDAREKWCIRRIPIAAYEWGVPRLEDWVEQDMEKDYSIQHPYSSLEEARSFIKDLKRRNG